MELIQHRVSKLIIGKTDKLSHDSYVTRCKVVAQEYSSPTGYVAHETFIVLHHKSPTLEIEMVDSHYVW